MDEKAIKHFWDRVDIRGKDECWEWRGGRQAFGHGRLRVCGRRWLAHRFSYTISFGPIPHGLFVLHKCDNPPCVNPNHLYVGTQNDNVQDRVDRDRSAFGEDSGKTCLTNEQVFDIQRLYNTGNYTQRDLAARYGVSISCVGNIIDGKRWVKKQIERTYVRGIGDIETAEKIRRLSLTGLSQYAIAKQFGIHQSSVSNIVNNKTWVR